MSAPKKARSFVRAGSALTDVTATRDGFTSKADMGQWQTCNRAGFKNQSYPPTKEYECRQQASKASHASEAMMVIFLS